QQGQRHSRVRRSDHGQREPANRRLVSVHRAAREAAARDGRDRRGWWLRLALRGADCRRARFESEGPWIFQIRIPAADFRRLTQILSALICENLRLYKNEESGVVTSIYHPD